MTDNTADKIAALEQEVARLKAKVSPPKSTFVPETDEEHRDRMHQMRERNASVIPPWLRDACAGGVSDADCADIVRASHRPIGRPGMIPDSSQQVSNARPAAGDGKGWAREIPLGPQPGIDLIDRGVNAALPHGPEWGKK
jgi:hypothetical protein